MSKPINERLEVMEYSAETKQFCGKYVGSWGEVSCSGIWYKNGPDDWPQAVEERCKPGTVLIDKSGLDLKQMIVAVRHSPLLGLKLGPNDIDKIGEVIQHSTVAQTMLSEEPGSAFGQMIQVELADQEKRPDRPYGGFDKVGINIYVDHWRKAGARIGRVKKDMTIEWIN